MIIISRLDFFNFWHANISGESLQLQQNLFVEYYKCLCPEFSQVLPLTDSKMAILEKRLHSTISNFERVWKKCSRSKVAMLNKPFMALGPIELLNSDRSDDTTQSNKDYIPRIRRENARNSTKDIDKLELLEAAIQYLKEENFNHAAKEVQNALDILKS